MAVWIVRHAVSGQLVDLYNTKKAATAAAKEMTEAHAKIEALHNGEPVTFSVEKRVNQEPVAEEAPAEEE